MIDSFPSMIRHLVSRAAGFPRGHAVAASVVFLSLAVLILSSPPAAKTVDATDYLKNANTGSSTQYEIDLPFSPEAKPSAVPDRANHRHNSVFDDNARKSPELTDTTPDSDPQLTVINSTVKKGDSLAKLFQRNKLSPQTLYAVMQAGGDTKRLSAIHPGQSVAFHLDEDRQLQKVVFQISKLETLTIIREDESYTSQVDSKPITTQIKFSGGTIENSLFLAAKKAGLSDSSTMQLANIFGWDVDFALDIRQGDSFELLYEQQYVDGEVFANGEILAARFINRSKEYSATRFEDEYGKVDYYDSKGNSVRKAFLRTPVDFKRISSGFNLKRQHPIFKTTRPHKGVDYAAPRGTPIKAAGDGKVVVARTKGGYGKAVVIQHGQKYSTLYGHLSSWAKSVKEGRRVRQGQVIGYVGSTGWATGPHLHYEFRVNGVHRNPLTVKLPDGQALPKRYMEEFLAQSSKMHELLALQAEDANKRRLAQNKYE